MQEVILLNSLLKLSNSKNIKILEHFLEQSCQGWDVLDDRDAAADLRNRLKRDLDARELVT